MGEVIVGIFVGYLGLIVAFLILASIMSYITIKSECHILVKMIIIAVSIWYSLALLYTPPNFLGWAADEEPPDNTIILHYFVKEIKANNESVFLYILGCPLKKTTQESSILYRWTAGLLLVDRGSEVPKYYRLCINKSEYKDLNRKNKESEDKNMLLVYRREKMPKNLRSDGAERNMAPGRRFDLQDPRPEFMMKNQTASP